MTKQKDSSLLTIARVLFMILMHKRRVVIREIMTFGKIVLREPSIGAILSLIGIGLSIIGFQSSYTITATAVILVVLSFVIGVVLVFKIRTNASIYRAIDNLGTRWQFFKLHLAGREQGGLYSWETSTSYYQQALDLNALPRFHDLHGLILQDLGANYVMAGNKNRALDVINESSQVYHNQGDVIIEYLGMGRMYAARMNVYAYFGDCSGSINNPGKAEVDFIKCIEYCSSSDPILDIKNLQYTEDEINRISSLRVSDAYGASKAHCQYAWSLMEFNNAAALWHSRVALEYAKLIEDSAYSHIFGFRDGAVGSFWRESFALFTIADCYTLLGDIVNADSYYSDSRRRIPFPERKAYFMGHYYWLFKCKQGEIRSARQWLKDTLYVSSNLDKYWWRVALTHYHMAELEWKFVNQTNPEKVLYENRKALEYSERYGFEIISKLCNTQYKLFLAG